MITEISLGLAALALVVAVALTLRVSRLQRRLDILPEDGGIFEALSPRDEEKATGAEAKAAQELVEEAVQEQMQEAAR